MLTDEKILNWARFLATKYASNVEGWTYSRDLGSLVHIRYKGDYTGRNVWWRRIPSGIKFSWNHNIYAGKRSIAFQLGGVEPYKSLWRRLQGFWIYFMIRARKDKNLPDGIVNGNITFWEEDGEYITLFGPTVGVKVLDFIESDPKNPHAVAILTEMRRMADKSFSGEEKEDESS